MRRTVLSSVFALGLVGAALRIAGASHVSPETSGTSTPPRAAGLASVGAIVGEWQSDKVGGVSARTNCAWSPYHGGVLCEQHLSTPKGASTALDLFTADSSSGRYTLYVLQRAGDAMTSVPFVIDGSRWTYGGTSASGDGHFYRTVNDFSSGNSYTWRQESSTDGKTWSAGVGGRNVRVGR